MAALCRLRANDIMPESGRTKSINGTCVRLTCQALDLCLLRDLQCVIDLDPKVSDGALQLGMTK